MSDHIKKERKKMGNEKKERHVMYDGEMMQMKHDESTRRKTKVTQQLFFVVFVEEDRREGGI